MRAFAVIALLTMVASNNLVAADHEEAIGDPERLERALRLHARTIAVREAIRASRSENGEEPTVPSALHLLAPATEKGYAERALQLTRRHLGSCVDDASCAVRVEAIDARLALLRDERDAVPFHLRVQAEASDAAVARQFTESIACCLCSHPGTCDDGVFCNGQEPCVANVCGSGTPPVCSDGDTCTADFCNGGIDACDSTPLPPPAEVAQVDLDKDAMDPAIAELVWTAVPGAGRYNLYRGQMVDLLDLTCFESGIAATTTRDDGTLSSSGVHVFLVTAEECGESGLGDDSAGPRNPPAEPCP